MLCAVMTSGFFLFGAINDKNLAVLMINRENEVRNLLLGNSQRLY